MVLFIGLLISVLHPFHASVCEIEFDRESQSLEVSYRMFADDLETALTTFSGNNIDLFNPNEKDNVDELVSDYLKEKLLFWVNDEERQFEFLGSELDNGALWCYVEIPVTTQVEVLAIDNSVMMELFDDQINLIHFNMEDNVRSMKLYKDRSYGVLRLSDLWKSE